MNENEMKIRTQWLIMWMISLIIGVINQLLQLRFNPMSNIPQVQYWSLAFALLVISILGYASYHCIYKKPGTKLLTSYLILSMATLVLNPILYLSGLLSPPDYIPYYGVFLLMTQGTGILWIVVCWRMLKVNKKLRAISKSSPVGE